MKDLFSVHRRVPVVTIDGPSGVGKSTLSKRLAERLGWNLLESGKLYRALALLVAEENIAVDDQICLQEAASRPLRFVRTPGESLTQVYLQDRCITDSIMTETCGSLASKLSQHESVRSALVAAQRQQAVEPGLVAEGRDMGTEIFPQAQLKIFLTADAHERAKRRYRQLIELGEHVKVDDLVSEIEARDKRDSDRLLAPLRPAGDAVVLDSTNLSLDEVLEQILVLWQSRS